jgi:hypothetical protein
MVQEGGNVARTLGNGYYLYGPRCSAYQTIMAGVRQRWEPYQQEFDTSRLRPPRL